ncbi:hypothetical protein BP6252_06030 [Coleophoma cylindrospora]|uniref:FAD-binding PCMH-type domain-containing protein n=1 Tax=Coleophoma cylindrospora TaxID=1849047 RepID=A0A3D8RLP6_9HELO|nr:hypothetical protein BP6252_06030 [Coleophoma cylindrospora]
MWPLWLLVVIPTLSLADAANQSSTYRSFSVQPPSQWSTGDPYTTLNPAGPTPTLVTITTSVQVFPTKNAFVATGLPVAPAPPNVYSENKPIIVDGIPGYEYIPLYQWDVKQSPAYTIDLTDDSVAVQCWYPISGNYCRLPRILFYITIAAAVLLRAHLPWLYLGALAASLTYSGVAAIHACLLVWRGPAAGELDLIALLAILSVSCITMVPLITWSSTIRTAGRPDLQSRENDERPKGIKEIDASARIILIFWAFLVTVGFVSAFIALQEIPSTRYAGHWDLSVGSQQQNFSCSPTSGRLNVTAGQATAFEGNGYIHFNFFMVTQEFVHANTCQNPCSNPEGGVALFRQESDLVLLTIPLLIINMVVVEIYLSEIPQSETSNHIGAWSSYASTALILLAPLLARSYETVKVAILQSGEKIFSKLPNIIWFRMNPQLDTEYPGQREKGRILEHDSCAGSLRNTKTVLEATGEFVFGNRFYQRAKSEWNELVNFIRDPDHDWDVYWEIYGPDGTGLPEMYQQIGMQTVCMPCRKEHIPLGSVSMVQKPKAVQVSSTVTRIYSSRGSESSQERIPLPAFYYDELQYLHRHKTLPVATDALEFSYIGLSRIRLSVYSDWPTPEVWEEALPGVEKTNGTDAEGTIPDYRFRVKNACDVQAAVKFAALHNIRLTVITTGHDQQGRSDAGSGLLIDLSQLRSVRVLESFTPTQEGVESPDPNVGPNVITPIPGVQAAVTFGPAVAGLALNYAVSPSNLFTVSGAAATVAISGGWGQNGGYGPMTAQYGLGVDQWLEAKVVTPDGELRVANAVTNTDLFWAIRGGGGGTFGVVVEATWKAYPAVPMTGFNWYINSTITDANATDPETGVTPVSEAMAYLMGEMPRLKELGISAYYYVSPSRIRCYAIHPGSLSGVANANALWGPILTKMQSFPNMTPFQTKPYDFKNYKEFFDTTYGPLADPLQSLPTPRNRGIIPYDSRLLAAEHLQSPNITYAFRQTAGNYGVLQTGPGLTVGLGNDTSANPGWRRAVVFIVGFKSETTNVDGLRELAPDMGTYINEASVDQQNWSEAFWGDNYPRLSAIKSQIDPNMTFWVSPGINADHMAAVDGRACLVEPIPKKPSLYAPPTDRHVAANLTVDGGFLFGKQELIGTQYPAPGTFIGLQSEAISV